MLLILGFLYIILYISYKIFISRKSNALTCLVGKTAIVTGGNAGLGYTTCLLLASRGCRVIIADKDNGEKSRDEIIKKTQNRNIIYKHIDLSSFKSIKKFSEDIINTEEKIDILINNAGIGAMAEKDSEDGLNCVTQINYLGAFFLTHLLMKALKASSSARIIFLGSVAIYLHQMTLESLKERQLEINFGIMIRTYSNSKLCNVLAAQEFAKKLKKYNISVYSVDPGIVKTKIYSKTYESFNAPIWSFLSRCLVCIYGMDSFQGAQTIFHLATSDEINGEETHYAYLIAFIKPPILKNQQFCDEIWKQSEKLVKLKEEEKL